MANIKDFAVGIVVTAPSPATSGTSVTLRVGDGATFPAAPFYVTATPPGTITSIGTSEKLLVTAVSTDTLTIVRAQSPTSAQSIGVGWIIANAIYTSDVTSSSIVMDEVLTGTVNGSNTVFTTANVFSNILLFKNGVTLHAGGSNDYTITGANQVTFTTAPATGTVLTATYIMGSSVMINGSNSLITDEVPSGTVNGSNTTFTVAKAIYVAGSLEVFINGVKQARVTHFTETTPSTGTFTMGDAPLTGDNIIVNYQFAASASGNADTTDGFHANSTPTAGNIPVLNSRAQSGEWWEEMGRTTLGATASSYTVNFTAKKYLTILFLVKATGGVIAPWIRFNGDSATNYPFKYSVDYSAGTSLTSQTGVTLNPSSPSTPINGAVSVINVAAEEKILDGVATTSGTAGGANATATITFTGKWANTSAQITSVTIYDSNGNTRLAAGSEIVILGHD